MKSKHDFVRRGQRLIRMVSELHRMGYQGLRIMPYMHPLSWRLAIAPRDVFVTRNGAYIPPSLFGNTCVITGTGKNYFDWEDAEFDNARGLAEKFVLRFPELVSQGTGRDWEYAGWLAELVGHLEKGDLLPAVYWDEMEGEPDTLELVPIWEVAKKDNLVWSGIKSSINPKNPNFALPPSVHLKKTMKDSGGIVQRVLEAIDGFKTKYGVWPTRLEADEATIAVLASHCLTPLGFFLLQSKVDVCIGTLGKILAIGADGEMFDYGEEGWQAPGGKHRHDAKQWIGLE